MEGNRARRVKNWLRSAASGKDSGLHGPREALLEALADMSQSPLMPVRLLARTHALRLRAGEEAEKLAQSMLKIMEMREEVNG